MREFIDVTGKTEDEAVSKALAQLGLDRLGYQRHQLLLGNVAIDQGLLPPFSPQRSSGMHSDTLV